MRRKPVGELTFDALTDKATLGCAMRGTLQDLLGLSNRSRLDPGIGGIDPELPKGNFSSHFVPCDAHPIPQLAAKAIQQSVDGIAPGIRFIAGTIPNANRCTLPWIFHAIISPKWFGDDS